MTMLLSEPEVVIAENEADVPAAATALQVTSLSKSFRDLRVFTDVSFAIAAGGRVALVGANGSGKSTLLRCCLGLIRPDAGEVFVEGNELTGCSPRMLRRIRSRIGVVFQRHHLVPQLSVLTNVIHGSLCRRHGPRAWLQSLAPRREREWALHCLHLVGLADRAKQRMSECSGGQSQRVAIARALMQEPRLLLADEPAASLDPQAGREVMALFSDLAEEQGLTLVFVSHHLEHAVRYADRVLGLRGGALALDRSTESLRAEELEGLYG